VIFRFIRIRNHSKIDASQRFIYKYYFLDMQLTGGGSMATKPYKTAYESFKEIVPQEENLGTFEKFTHLSTEETLEMKLNLEVKLSYTPYADLGAVHDVYIATLQLAKKKRPTPRNSSPDRDLDVSVKYKFNSMQLGEIIENMYSVANTVVNQRILGLSTPSDIRILLKLAMGIEESIMIHEIPAQRHAAEQARLAITNHVATGYFPDKYMG
jgi:hypothetical protein